ncbi:pre-rRNA-processing protein TSR1 homolog [Temnothorax curvispinosus]|uniref:Pre-rRNA-processing protein TSR1 homolog n=1 Tax=Temnothorax curvispinosus TaxID=300111 RepID=A0A6J1QJY5_9HYME|nr:pre-rRNA-processing protein TSR1 homolog [Temnothorax curvispinosus]XP_024882749.1 pre-rRNA-processing protein TSR1 homolog [Temnothorax curvispinosus]
MNMIKQETHRPGALKQSNKQHKTGRHRSKSTINNDLKGKQNVIGKSSKRFEKNLRKDERRNQLLQLRRKKREQVLAQKRNLGGFFSAPILICVIPLQSDVDIKNIVSAVTNMAETANVATSPNGIIHIGVPRLKRRFSIVVPSMGDVLATLDAAKVATTILFVTSVASQTNDGTQRDIIDDWGKEIIVSCLAQGLPSTMIAVHNIQRLHIKKRQEYKQSVQRAISKWIPEEKVLELDTAADCLNMLRRAGSQKQRSLFYKDIRPYLLAEKVSYECDQDSPEFGTLMVSGYLRGTAPLSANDLVHIPGFGDFQMSCIKTSTDPYLIEHGERIKYLSDDKMKTEQRNETEMILTADPEKQESLESEYIPDPMDAEQTWPTKEELAEAANNRNRKIVKVVPKGTSEYQAAWIPDEDGESLGVCSGNESEDNMSVEEARSEAASSEDLEDDEQYETITISEAPLDEERYDQDIDMFEEKQAMENFKEAKLDAQFPDEVDTPQNILAKARFQKYRGLESFRTSPWDPKENLPIDYSRIIEFADYDRRRKCIYKERKDIEGVTPGSYIQVCIIHVNREAFKAFAMVENKPLIVVALLPYEHKMSLLNIVLKHSSNYTRPIKSKERLIFQCGFRRFAACPIFSQHTNGAKHKYERYFHPDSTVVASMYAPVTFSPCPILCYVENKSGKLELIATGSVLSCNPNRIVLKRVVLSGHPYKVNKRSVVVRFMFFHREDIEWFKPIQLRTKYGRRGHIKEPLGTHGHMKCIFNDQLKSQDTVLMNLYKRVFPKWTYEPMNQYVQ